MRIKHSRKIKINDIIFRMMKISIEQDSEYADVIVESNDGAAFSFCLKDGESAKAFSAELEALIKRFDPQ